jgi:hypothetical protein
MFRDLHGYYPGPEKPKPARRLTPREEKIGISILAFNILAMILAPIGGVSVLEALFR